MNCWIFRIFAKISCQKSQNYVRAKIKKLLMIYFLFINIAKRKLDKKSRNFLCMLVEILNKKLGNVRLQQW